VNDTNVTEAQAQLKTMVGASPTTEAAPRAVIFAVADARRALPYVARIARDASEAFLAAQQCRMALDGEGRGVHRTLLIHQRDDALHRLNFAIDECNAVGADLLDFATGLVRFNCQTGGRVVDLHWRLGESVDSPWAEPVAIAD
jgi:hypothetical protein